MGHKNSIAKYLFNDNFKDERGNYDGVPSGFGPVAEYHFDGDVTDETGNYNLTAVNSPTYRNGVVGSAIDLQASYSQYLLGSLMSFGTNDLEIDFWVRSSVPSFSSVILDTRNTSYGAGGIGILIQILNDGRVAAYIGDGNNFVYVVSTSIVSPYAFVHIRFRVDRKNNRIKIYANNKLQAINDSSLVTGDLDSGEAHFKIGSQFSIDAFLDGSLDDFRINGYALSESEGWSIYNRPQQPSYFVDSLTGKAISCGESRFIQTSLYPNRNVFSVAVWLESGDWSSSADMHAVSNFDFVTEEGNFDGFFIAQRWTIPNSLNFGVYNKSGEILACATGSGEVSSNEPHFAVGVFKAGERQSLYLDGELIVTKTTGVPSYVGTEFPIRFAARAETEFPYNWKGNLDNIRIFDRALSQEEISYLYENPEADSLQAPESIAVEFRSKENELVYRIDNNTNLGSTLKVKWDEIKNGGTDTLEIVLGKKVALTYYPDMSFVVLKDGIVRASGYTETTPESDTSNYEQVLSCLGWMHKLKDNHIDKIYASVSLEEAFEQLETFLNAVGLLYDVDKINVPDLLVTFIFEDAKLLEVINSLVGVANYDLNNTEYRWFIDSGKCLNIDTIGIGKTLFEGWHYQFPEVDWEDSNILNKLTVYYGDPDTLSTVVVENTEGQVQYGLRSDKLLLPWTDDATTAENIGKSIVEYWGNPRKVITVKDMINDFFEFNKYSLNNQPRNRWSILATCDTEDNWTLESTNVVYSLDDLHVLTGNLSLKVALSTNLIDDSFFYTPIKPLFSVEKVNLSFYFIDVFLMVIRLHSSDGTYFDTPVGTGDSTLDVDDGSGADQLFINDGSTIEGVDVTVVVSVSDQWYNIEITHDLFTLSKVEIIFKDRVNDTFWLDNINVFASGPVHSELVLEKVSYESAGKDLLAQASFGGVPVNLIDEVVGKDNPNKSIFNAFTK